MNIQETQKGYEKEFKTNAINEFLTFDGDVLGGVPFIKDTDIPAYKIFAELAEGRNVSDVAKSFNLDPSKIKGVLTGLGEMFQISFYDD